MGRHVDPKTETLHVYVRPDNRKYVKTMKKLFKSESNYIDALIKHDKGQEVLKKIMLQKIEELKNIVEGD